MDTIVPGALAAFVVDCSIYPVDTIKSRIQAVDYKERYPQGRGLYQGLWQGFGPVVLATLPSAAVFFTTYENAKLVFTSPETPIIGDYVSSDPRALALAHTASSAVAELAACLIVTPAESLKQQMHVATKEKKRVKSTEPFRVRTIWRGYWALVGRNLPFTAMQFPLYEFFRARLAKRVGLPERKGGLGGRAGHQGEPSDMADVMVGDEARKRAYQTIHRNNTTPTNQAMPSTYQHYVTAGLVSGASGAGAGGISALITSPLDLIKTRIMLQQTPEKGTKSPSMLAVTADILKREGFAGLMRGGLLRCTWTAFGAGIYLGAYESGREWWNEAGKAQVRNAADQASEMIEEVKGS